MEAVIGGKKYNMIETKKKKLKTKDWNYKRRNLFYTQFSYSINMCLW